MTINTILEDFYNEKVVDEENCWLSDSGKYYVPSDGSKNDYITFIETTIPMNDLTEVFGMHDNAEITSAINATNSILQTALLIQPRSGGGAG